MYLLSLNLKDPCQQHLCFCLITCYSLAIIFYSELVETKEITVRLLTIIRYTFRNITYSKELWFHVTTHYQIVSLASKMAKAD